jgi:hypothetical protein
MFMLQLMYLLLLRFPDKKPCIALNVALQLAAPKNSIGPSDQRSPRGSLRDDLASLLENRKDSVPKPHAARRPARAQDFAP